MPNLDPVTIILAEDDDGHAHLVQKNLTRAGLTNPVIRVKDGQEALDLLHNRGEFQGKMPKGSVLLVLDVKMPRVDGIEVLRQVKSNSELAKIPTIMLTTTDDPREIERCYELKCNVYLTKPVEYEAFVEAIRRLGLFLQLVRFPENGPKVSRDAA